MTNNHWHPDDLKTVFPSMPESCALALRQAAGSLKEEREVKMRYTLRLVAAAMLVLICLTGVALAVFHPSISEIFGQRYGEDFQSWLEEGGVAAAENSIVLDGVTFTLNEVALRNHGLYGTGTITPGEGQLLLCPDYPVTEPYGYATFHGEDAPEGTPSILEKAAAEGSVIKQVSFCPDTVSADGGDMLFPGSCGFDLYPQKDGTALFIFELEDGVAIPAGAQTYTIRLYSAVYDVTADGEADQTNPVTQYWTVDVSPQPFAEVLGTSPETSPTPEPDATEASALQPLQVIVPEEYKRTGTMPVYEAKERDFDSLIRYEWFNQSGVEKEQRRSGSRSGSVSFADGGYLDWSSDHISYTVYDGTYEATSEYADGTKFTETLPKCTMPVQVSYIAGWMHYGFPGTDEVYGLESEQLSAISLQQAQSTAEALMQNFGMEGYRCIAQLDMGVERIHEMGALYNQQIDNGALYTNEFRYDYSTATAEDEGYFLIYRKYDGEADFTRQYEAVFYVTASGIQSLTLHEAYIQGGVIHTPDSFVDASAVAAALPREMNNSRYPEELKQILSATLTWMPVRNSNGEGMIFTPVWVLSYLSCEPGCSVSDAWAVFDAVDGHLINAAFN